jgi:hypothetical protein
MESNRLGCGFVLSLKFSQVTDPIQELIKIEPITDFQGNLHENVNLDKNQVLRQ